MRETIVSAEGETLMFDATLTDSAELTELFASSKDKAIEACTRGRGTAHFIERGDQQWVIREYRRGGLVSKVVASTYCYTGLDRTRMAREFRLLAYLYEMGLPVPRPVAVRIKRSGIACQGELMTQRLPVTETLGDRLQTSALTHAQWAGIGRCIRRFHDNGACHADLNANNIMLDDERVYLIDFDRGCRRNPSQDRWRQSNLKRLQHSLNKLRGQCSSFHFSAEDWTSLCDGYAGASDIDVNCALKAAR